MNDNRYAEILATLHASYPGRVRLNVNETATALGIAVQTIYNGLHASQFPIPAVYEGRRPGFLVSDIARHLAQGGV